MRRSCFKGVFYSKAFTLIELLVVVLIIGILAAVAVPQYQKAVWRNRYIQAKTMATSLAKAMEIYYLANGTYTADAYALDIEVTGSPDSYCNTEEKRKAASSCNYETLWGRCTLLAEGQVQCVLPRDGKKFLLHVIYLPHSTNSSKGRTYCFAENDYKGAAVTADDLNYQICSMETGKNNPSPGWNIVKAFLY